MTTSYDDSRENGGDIGEDMLDWVRIQSDNRNARRPLVVNLVDVLVKPLVVQETMRGVEDNFVEEQTNFNVQNNFRKAF